MQEIGLTRKLKRKVNLILKELIANDPHQKTRFEYSLQIEDRQLKRNLRFVNYDTHYETWEQGSYLKRINLIEKIARSYFDQKSNLMKLFDLIKRISFFRLPLALGVEVLNNHSISLKIYLNFFSLYYNEDEKLVHRIIQRILDECGFKIKIKKRKIALLGLAVNKTGGFNCKIYYLYDKNFNLENAGFTHYELKVFRWLNQYNRLPYFDIMERYNRNKLISRKIEIHPKNSSNFLMELCRISDNQALFSKIQTIINKTNGEIEAVAIEKKKLTIYITLLNYGKKEIRI